MNKFQLTLLGTNAASPAYGRITSCQILDYNNHLILIDCGEGCQIRFNEYKIKRSKIELICISHLHGDHIFGLPGLLTSYNLQGREDPLTIIGPVGIKQFIADILRTCESELMYPHEIIELSHDGKLEVARMDNVKVSAFPMKHRIRTYGYLFEEQQGDFKVRKEAIEKYTLSIPEIKSIKSGDNIIRDGIELPLKEMRFPKEKPRSYAYCSDTVYDPDLVPLIKGVDYLYHETTYTKDLEQQATERMHSTAEQAAKIASAAEVKMLITGHYSSRYRYPDAIKEEAVETFENTLLGYDGMIVNF